MSLKLILPVKYVPNNSKATKPTGEKIYTIQRKVKVHGEACEQRIELEGDGVVFLVSKEGEIVAIAEEREVEVCDLDDVKKSLNNYENYYESKH